MRKAGRSPLKPLLRFWLWRTGESIAAHCHSLVHGKGVTRLGRSQEKMSALYPSALLSPVSPLSSKLICTYLLKSVCFPQDDF